MTDGQKDKQTDGQTQTDRQTDGQTDGQRDYYRAPPTTSCGALIIYHVLTTSYLSFPIYSRKEIETKILERKSKQKISRFIDLIYRLFNIMLDSNWLIFSPMGGQEYIDISKYVVVKSRFLSRTNNLIDFISILLNIGKER